MKKNIWFLKTILIFAVQKKASQSLTLLMLELCLDVILPCFDDFWFSVLKYDIKT